MVVLVTTPEFLEWCRRRGYTQRDLESPPVAWMLVELFKWERDAERETSGR